MAGRAALWYGAVCIWQATHCFSNCECVPGKWGVVGLVSTPTVARSMLYCSDWWGGSLQLVQEAPRSLWHWAHRLTFALYWLGREAFVEMEELLVEVGRGVWKERGYRSVAG